MMTKRSANLIAPAIIFLLFFLASCQSVSSHIAPTITSVSTPTILPSPSPTNSSTPTVLPTASSTQQSAHHADLMIFVAHPDDETICCATMIQQALAEGKRVQIVIFTNGDGWDIAAAHLAGKSVEALKSEDYIEMAGTRQKETLDALAVLGLNSSNVTFLGYPDGGLEEIYNNRGQVPYTHKFTLKNSTYGPLIQDYHSTVFGSPAMYLRQNVLDDVSDIVLEWEPDVIYIHDKADSHPDHKSVFRFVRDVFQSLGRPRYVFTFCNTEILQHIECPEGLACPAPKKVSPTADQAVTKYDSLMLYQSQMWILFKTEEDLQDFSELDEPFWTEHF